MTILGENSRKFKRIFGLAYQCPFIEILNNRFSSAILPWGHTITLHVVLHNDINLPKSISFSCFCDQQHCTGMYQL